MDTQVSSGAVSSDSYFPQDLHEENQVIIFLKKFWHAFQYYARLVWPTIHRLISFLVYETLKVLKGIVKIGLQQIGLFKD